MLKFLLKNSFIFKTIMRLAVTYVKADADRCSRYTSEIRRAVRQGNKVVFHSEKFGTVILVKKGLVESETYYKGKLMGYYKGQLAHDWEGTIAGELCRNPGNVLECYRYSKGQVVWLSKEYFSKKS